MATELATRNGSDLPARALQGATSQLYLTPRSIEEAAYLAEAFAKTGMFAVKTKEAALTVLLTGLELGLGPAQSMRSISIIQNKPTLNAEAMLALCRSRPNICKYFHLIESTDKIATYETWRVGSPSPVTMSFTIDMAQAAGLLNNPTWAKYRATMLRWRCVSMMVKEEYSDICLGLYTPEELGAAEIDIESGAYDRRQNRAADDIDGTTGQVIEQLVARVYSEEEKVLIREINAGLQTLDTERRERALNIRRAYGVGAVKDMSLEMLRPYKVSVVKIMQEQQEAQMTQEEESPVVQAASSEPETEEVDPFADAMYCPCGAVVSEARLKVCEDENIDPPTCDSCAAAALEQAGQGRLMDAPDKEPVSGPDGFSRYAEF